MPHHTTHLHFPSLSLSPICLLSHSLHQLVAGCLFICHGRATTGFLKCWRAAGKVEGEEEVEEGKEKKRSSFVKRPSLIPLWQQQPQHPYRCLHQQRRSGRRSRCWMLRLLPGSASTFSSGSSSWNWEGEGDHHLPVCHGPSARQGEL